MAQIVARGPTPIGTRGLPGVGDVDERARRRSGPWRARAVLALDLEVRASDGAGQFRLLAGELEAVLELGRHVHAIGELEPDRPLRRVVDGPQDVDRQPALV